MQTIIVTLQPEQSAKLATIRERLRTNTTALLTEETVIKLLIEGHYSALIEDIEHAH